MKFSYKAMLCNFFYDINDKEVYNHVEIYEIYIEELINQKSLIEKDKYAKMVLELVEVLVSRNVEEYTNSNNPLTKKVAEKIMRYTEEEVKKMQEQFERENQEEIRIHDMILSQALEKQLTETHVLTMAKNGANEELISKLLELPIELVQEIIESKK